MLCICPPPPPPPPLMCSTYICTVDLWAWAVPQVHLNDWGTLSTISRNLSTSAAPVPYGSTVSYSDGPLSRSTGRLLFYLTLLDAAAYDLQRNKVATLSVTEAQIFGSCGVTDPEVCAGAMPRVQWRSGNHCMQRSSLKCA